MKNCKKSAGDDKKVEKLKKEISELEDKIYDLEHNQLRDYNDTIRFNKALQHELYNLKLLNKISPQQLIQWLDGMSKAIKYINFNEEM